MSSTEPRLVHSDSIYTERYMMLPSTNEMGYALSGISNVTAFRDVDFLLAHGSGDDNVHFANSAHLLDMFTQAQVRNFRFRMFTDRCVPLVLYGDQDGSEPVSTWAMFTDPF